MEGKKAIVERKAAWLKVECEAVPDRDAVSDDEWREWCEARGFDALGGWGRGAWISEIGTYLRGARWLVYADGALVDLADEHDLADGRIAFADDAETGE